ncbi:linker for activation of T-cells family member 2 [Myripristis murdjan]|uniref:linker for activation of T-cells family member 2 n=1 Tax=Myripristis murdjan TaxID=586833 RepID=UPI001175E0B4|nr:linker for activation of T-cells family member 2-like [Myripristis murdjan]
MTGESGVLAAGLTLVSVVSLSALSLLCLRCRRKTKIIHEENQIYDPQIFQRGGSRFVVTQSKTVTRPNEIHATIIEEPADPQQVSRTMNKEQPKYQNVIDAQRGSFEPTYVAPLPVSVYENVLESEEIQKNADQDLSVYENVITSLPVNDGDDDYENTEFLNQAAVNQEDDEPDYVNAGN